jgi:hypothetical protein
VQRIRNFAAGLAVLSAFAACDTAVAAGMSPDPTGLWFDPAESGWGLSLVQRDDTIFALLLVYDEARRPTWYVASDVTADGPSGMDPGAMQYTGVLYRTAGPWFGGAFDPQSLSSAAVGTIRLQYAPGTQGRTMDLAYAVNGVSTVREVEPQLQPRAVSTEPIERSQVH